MRPAIGPGQVWFVDFGPMQDRDPAMDRPALVVSSRFHLDLTMGSLVCVLPLTSVERPDWLHRIRVGSSGWIMTEHIRTVSADRFRRYAPEVNLSGRELDEVRRVLAHMLTV